MTLGIVYRRHEVGSGCCLDTPLDCFPRCHQVTQGDDAHIMSDRGSQQGRGFLESGDSR